MANPQVQIGQSFVGTVLALDAQGNPAASLQLTIDDYASAYVAAAPGANQGQAKGFEVVLKNQNIVGIKTLTLTTHAKTVGGQDFPQSTFAVDFVGSAPAPVFGNPQEGTFPLQPDPGSAVATLI